MTNPDPKHTASTLAGRGTARATVPPAPGGVTPLAYDIPEACRLSRQSRSSIYAAIGRGELIARKIRRRTVILAPDLAAWLENLPKFPPRKPV